MVDWKYVVGRAYLSETAGRHALLKSILIAQFVRFGFGFFADIGGSDRHCDYHSRRISLCGKTLACVVLTRPALDFATRE
jgi:hypothetical protein